MTLSEFDQQTVADQAYCIWQQGIFLLTRKQQDYRLFLYDMGLFFAEVSYNLPANRLGSIRSFNKTADLTPYVDLIDFSDLPL